MYDVQIYQEIVAQNNTLSSIESILYTILSILGFIFVCAILNAMFKFGSFIFGGL